MTPDARIGTVLAGHRIEAEVGRGGMGVVYLAEHLHLGRKVALKLLPPEFAQNEGFRERFVRESQLAATIDHPNVIPVYDAGEADGLLYISMRFVDGEDLNTLIAREAPLAAERAVGIIELVAAALDAAHKGGLVHRDVKPANVLIGRDGHVYLTDFGLTKRTDSRSGLTGTGLVVGTVAYMAPEQFRAGELDARTDVYSLGCVLYKSLTGHTPFERDTEAATMYAHLNDPPPRPSERGVDVPPGLDEAVSRAMAKRMEDRFATCREFGRATRVALTEESTTREAPAHVDEAPTDPATAPHRPPPSPRRRLRIVLASIVGAAIVLFGAALLFGDRSPRTNSLSGARSGRLLFSSERTGNWDVYVADADGSDPRNLTNAPSDDFPAAPSPDGRKIAFRTDRDGNYEIYVMDADGTDVVRLTNDPAEDLFPNWSPNSRLITFTSERGGNKDLFLMNADGSNLRRLTSDPADDLNGSFSPDGKQMVFESDRDGDLNVFVLDLSNGAVRRLTQDPASDRNALWSPKGDLIAFTSDRAENDEIYTMRPDGTNLINRSNNPAKDFYLTFTNDGNSIVFQTDRSGNDDIWIMRVDGSDPRPLIDDPAADHVPRWTR